MNILCKIIIWINAATNALGRYLLAPLMTLPGWLSNTIISAVAGVVLLIIFKYTSNQKAIGKVRDAIKADMLALKLFKDSMAVTLKSQGNLLKGAIFLLLYAIKPMLFMIIPVSLLLAQMGLWYQFRPLEPAEETIVTMQLNKNGQNWPDVKIESAPAFDVPAGPVKVKSQNQIYWKIKIAEEGNHEIKFLVDGQEVQKQLVAGKGFLPISTKRPGPNFSDILMYPAEKPFTADSVVQSISIDYPDRPSKTSGSDYWIVYFFIASLVFALIFKPILKVRI